MPSMKMLCAVAFLLSACVSDSNEPAPQHEVPDQNDDEACVPGSTKRYPTQVEYSAGLEREGTKGVSVTLVEAMPAPPARGINEWSLLVKLDGEPVEGARMQIVPWMTKHGHATTAQTVVTDQGGGVYDAAPINLGMAGFFDVKITVAAGGVSDAVNFGFCVD